MRVPPPERLSGVAWHEERVHGHTWNLQAVICEDGVMTEEFVCIECADVVFR